MNDSRIRPWAENAWYWQYRGEPILLLGGSIEDNLFQISDLADHLDLMVSCGGNYVRNTMSSRDPGDVWPFARSADGSRYDLERPNDEYWRRFADLLRLTHERGIVVQVELWDRFDCYREPWHDNPFNPANNVNYGADDSGLAEDYQVHPATNQNPFLVTVPDGSVPNRTVLPHQQRFVDWVLADSLRYDHVLYCMDNETKGMPQWGAYWSRYVAERAARTGVAVETTEMWDPWDLSDPLHRHTFDHPELYSFVDVSQNNQQRGQTHWDNLQRARSRLPRPCPVNNVKVYGADSGPWGGDSDGVERFWRNIFGGCASARFHRPPSGHGLGPTGQRHLRSARLLAETVPVWHGEPRNDLLADRVDNGAYCLAHCPPVRHGTAPGFADPGAYHAVLFPGGASVRCDVSALGDADPVVSWLDVDSARWLPASRAPRTGRWVRLTAPTASLWVALVRPAAADR